MKLTSIIIFLIILFSCKNESAEIGKLRDELDRIKIITLQDSLQNAVKQSIIDSMVSVSSKSLDLSTQYEKLKSSIFLVYTADSINVNQGTAFLIDNDGTCISNFHVFKDAEIALVVNINGHKYEIEDIIEYNEEHDYIIFKINLENNFINPLKIASTSPRIGEECFTIGNPEGLQGTISKGIISGYRNNNSRIQTTAEITHGSSGGPLFNSNGEVVGITTSGVGQANLNFAVNINQLDLERFTSSSGTSKEQFTVISDRAYFHNSPEPSSRRSAYLVKGDYGNVIESRNGYIFIIYQNSHNQTSTGWISIRDISFSKSNLSVNTTHKATNATNRSTIFNDDDDHKNSNKNSNIGYTNGSNIIIRKRPTTQSDVVGSFLTPNQKVIIIDKKISESTQTLLNREVTFSSDDDDDEITVPKGKAVTVISRGPSTSTISFTIPVHGTVSGIVDNSYIDHHSGEYWYYIEEVNGIKKGWVFGKFLTFE